LDHRLNYGKSWAIVGEEKVTDVERIREGVRNKRRRKKIIYREYRRSYVKKYINEKEYN